MKKRFGTIVGLVHGRMRGVDKDRAMDRFAAGETRLLVATTVIEVGVDVPEASVMVIEHAERFGLAQLHQLRGRIGRGTERSTCLLLYKAPLGVTAKPGLRSCAKPMTGSGSPRRTCGSAAKATCSARGKAACPDSVSRALKSTASFSPRPVMTPRLMLARDPKLGSPRGEALRHLLYLFARDEAIRLLSAG